MYCLQQCGVKNIVKNQEKPILNTQETSLYPKMMRLYIWWDWNGIVYYKILCKINLLNSLFPSKSHKWKASSICQLERCPLSSEQYFMSPFTPWRYWCGLSGMSYYICHAHLILHLWITTHFNPTKILLMRKISILLAPVKTTERNQVLGTWTHELTSKTVKGRKTK